MAGIIGQNKTPPGNMVSRCLQSVIESPLPSFSDIDFHPCFSISNIQLSSVLAYLATFLCPKSKESVNKKMKDAQISYKQMGKTPGWEFYSDEMKPSPYGQNK
jgi:hypothetical protein